MKANRIRISFPDEKTDYSVVADLELQYAPKTCAATCDFLGKQGGSFTGRVFHTIFNGYMLGLPDFDLSEDLPEENGTITPAQGEIVYIYLPAGSERRLMKPDHIFAIFYGPDNRIFAPMGWWRGRVFGRVTDKLDVLAQMGKLVREEGERRMRVELVK